MESRFIDHVLFQLFPNSNFVSSQSIFPIHIHSEYCVDTMCTILSYVKVCLWCNSHTFMAFPGKERNLVVSKFYGKY
jgi:hypothetical protein